jgi:hypothetical protein
MRLLRAGEEQNEVRDVRRTPVAGTAPTVEQAVAA